MGLSLHGIVDIAREGRVMLLLDALGLMLVEYLFHRANDLDSHDASETAVSLAIAIGGRIFSALTASIAVIPVLYVYRYRLLDIRLDAPLPWLALFLGVELSYYLHHVAMHKIRWFWATHAVHHSATRLNLTAAVRTGWGGHLSGGFLFYLPLVLVGFHPAAVFGVLGVGLLYQFFLHLAYAPQLGPLEWVFNTPRHHQVHHACNEACVDKNFGSVLIVFDRMFGTFAAPPEETLRYGLAEATPTRNMLKILFGNWTEIFRDARRADSVAAKLRSVFGKPA
jgi:sterol desaturase/sphingolipid hydroxylase (fatty acid hydroxylase superfamily)